MARRSRLLSRGAVAVLAGLLISAGAGAAPRPQDADKICFVCHDDPGLKSSSGSPRYVKPTEFAASVHGQAGIGCLGCHSDLEGVADFPHAANLESVICARCHADFARMTSGGVHAMSSPRLAAAPVLCKDCHGYHNVLPSADPRSPLHASNRPATCGRCHPGAGPNFARGGVHTPAATGPGTPAWVVRTLYRALIAVLGAFFLVYIAVDLLRRRMGKVNEPAAGPAVLIPEDEIFIRMDRTERWQHGLLAGAFVVLILSGLPDLLGRSPFAAGVRGLFHRGAAIVLIGDLVWQALSAVFTPRGRERLRDMRPSRQDVRDGLAFFGLRPGGRPKPDRYSFVEKFDYWALALGSAIMIVTGSFMELPDLSLKLFPLWLHQVFVVIHGYEAILAFVAILIWHMYTVHLNPEVFPMSRVWLDGRMTGAELRRRHPLEYRRILESRERLYRELLALEPGSPDRGPAPGGPPSA